MSGTPRVRPLTFALSQPRLTWLALATLTSPLIQAAEATSTQALTNLGADPKHYRPIIQGQTTATDPESGTQTPETRATGAQADFGQDPTHTHPPEEATAAPAAPADGEDDGPLRFPPREASGEQSYPYLQLNGLIEAGWVHVKPFEGSTEDEWIVSTLELMMTFQPHPWVTVQASGLYEDNGRSPLELDVAQLRVGPPEGTWFVDSGQFYLPFGRYASNMVSDPLTLELGETREVAGALGFAYGDFFGAAYGFNGQQHERDNESLDEWGAEVGYAGQVGAHPLTLALGYLSDIGDSDRLSAVVEDDQRVGGLAASLLFEAGPWTLIGEYVTATQRFGPGAGKALVDQRPSAWMIEAGYAFDLMGKGAQVALGYQGTVEALALELPESRGLVTFNLGLYDYTLLQLEYAHDQDYGESAGGTGNSGHTVTAQVAISF